MSPDLRKLFACVEDVFTDTLKGLSIREVVAKDAGVIMSPVGDLAVFSAGVVTDLSPGVVSKALEESLKVALFQRTMWRQIGVIVCKREERVLAVYVRFVHTANSPIH